MANEGTQENESAPHLKDKGKWKEQIMHAGTTQNKKQQQPRTTTAGITGKRQLQKTTQDQTTEKPIAGEQVREKAGLKKPLQTKEELTHELTVAKKVTKKNPEISQQNQKKENPLKGASQGHPPGQNDPPHTNETWHSGPSGKPGGSTDNSEKHGRLYQELRGLLEAESRGRNPPLRSR